jgi:hypothetical protein
LLCPVIGHVDNMLSYICYFDQVLLFNLTPISIRRKTLLLAAAIGNGFQAMICHAWRTEVLSGTVGRENPG